MKWNLSEADYPQIDIAVQHIGGLAAWFEKILDLAPNYTAPWNVLIADLWPNGDMSRLIGHVQMDDVSVGYDTGYRVCAYLTGDRMVYDSGDDRDLVNQWLNAAVATPQLQTKLRSVCATNPFHIRLIHWGENPISEAIEIAF